MAIVAHVEGKEAGGFPFQLRRHLNIRFADCEMHNCAAPRFQQSAVRTRFVKFRMTIPAIFLHGVIDVLREVRLDFSCRNRNTIDEEHQGSVKQ